MFVYVYFLVRYYYVECTDFMYDSIKVLLLLLLLKAIPNFLLSHMLMTLR